MLRNLKLCAIPVNKLSLNCDQIKNHKTRGFCGAPPPAAAGKQILKSEGGIGRGMDPTNENYQAKTWSC
jgi:hypothetical protein